MCDAFILCQYEQGEMMPYVFGVSWFFVEIISSHGSSLLNNAVFSGCILCCIVSFMLFHGM